MDNQVHVLYQFYDRDDELLYVGITMNPPARFRNHQSTKWWWSQVVRIQLETFESRPKLAQAEWFHIKFGHPKYNILHAPEPLIWPDWVKDLCREVMEPAAYAYLAQHNGFEQ